jgi:RNA 2',3'-cyclic 3'-phosphodiesterase
VRCFIALPLPDEARAALGRVAGRLKAAWPGLAWTRPEGYHITLAFLGDISGAAVECAKAAVDAAARARPVELSFEELGGFPPRGPWRVLVALAEDDGASELAYRLVNEALASHERADGLPPLNPEWPDGRPFRPHATLARIGGAGRDRGDGAGGAEGRGRAPGPRELAALVGEAERRELARGWRLDRCVLYRSELRSSGAVYTELKSVRMGEDGDPLADENE